MRPFPNDGPRGARRSIASRSSEVPGESRNPSAPASCSNTAISSSSA